MPLSPLPAEFYQQSAPEVALHLLGARLVRWLDGKRLAGTIVETEAYLGESDLACHARAGRTQRTRVMYGPPGRAYVYFIYGIHWMLNCVTGAEGDPQAVLIRAILPVEGVAIIAQRRGGHPGGRHAHVTDGPARLCQALAIDGSFNGADLCDPLGELFIQPDLVIPPGAVRSAPRVGIERVPEPWRSKPWRFRVDPTALTALPSVVPD